MQWHRGNSSANRIEQPYQVQRDFATVELWHFTVRRHWLVRDERRDNKRGRVLNQLMRRSAIKALNYLNLHFLVVHEQRLVRKYLEEEQQGNGSPSVREGNSILSVPRLVKYNRQIIRFLSFSCSSWRFVPDCFVEGLNRRKPYQSSIKLRGGFVQSSTTVPFHLI